MNTIPSVKNHRPAAASRSIGPRSCKNLQVTIITDGTWFTVHGDKKDDTGVDLHFSTDGRNAELTIHADGADSLLPTLRLYRDRPA